MLETPGGWSLHAIGRRVSPLTATAPDDLAKTAAAFAASHRLGRDVVIAVDSDSSLFVPLGRLDEERPDRVSLTFALEDDLPLDAEQIVADFDLSDPPVGLAVDADRLEPIVGATEDAGLRVQAIVPAASLLAAALPRRSERLVWTRDGQCDVIDRERDRLIGWRRCSADRLDATLTLEPSDRPVVAVGDPTPDSAAALTIDADEAIRRQAGRLLAGRLTPQFELRRDRLDSGDPHRRLRGTLAWTAVAATVFSIVASGLLLHRASELRDETAELRQEQRDLFAKALPGTEPPRALMTRFRREHRKLLGARQIDPAVPETVSALDVLHDVLDGLTDAVRSRITDLRITDGEIRIAVELNAHADAARLAESLEVGGFRMDSPATSQRDDGTIVSTLRGDWLGMREPAGDPAVALRPEAAQ